MVLRLGGCEFAPCFDFIIGLGKCHIRPALGGVGHIPGGGRTQFLPRLIGRNRAKELIFTWHRRSFGEGIDIGLVNHVVTHENPMAKTMELTHEI